MHLKHQPGLDNSAAGKLFLPVLSVLVLLGYLWTRQYEVVWLCLSGLIIWRLFCSRSISLSIITLSLLALFGWRQMIFTMPETDRLTGSGTFTVPADQYKINGDLLTGTAKSKDGRVFVMIKLHSQKQKRQLTKNSHRIYLQLDQTELCEIAPPTNQAEFDFKRWAAHRQIKWQIQGELKSFQTKQPSSLSDWIAHFRKAFLNWTATQPRYCAFHLRALIAGYSDRDDFQIRELLSTLGIIHLFALSGLHVDLLIMIVRKFGSSLRIVDEVSRGLLILMLPIYALFVGGQIGILRAILMYLIREICRLVSCHLETLDQLMIVLLLCLWLQPAAMLEIGPQLSFTLSLALRLMPRNLNRWRLQLRLSYLTMGIVVFWTYTFNLLALVMGGLFAPLFSYLILPLTIMSLFVPRTSQWIEPIWRILYRGLSLLNERLPAQLMIGSLSIVALMIIVCCGLLASEKKSISRHLRLFMLLPFMWTVVTHQMPLVDKVTVIDIGQGDSILIQTAFPRKTLLIDTGGQLGFKRPAWQERRRSSRVAQITVPYLRSQGIDHLDHVLLTHQDADHLGDLDVLLKEIPVTQLLFTKGMDQNPSFVRKVKASRFANQYRPKLAGDLLESGRLRGLFVAPQHSGCGHNEDSLSLLINVGSKRWLFTGDLDRAHEREILDLYPNLKVDILKVGHHGSKTASDPDFIRAIHPELALISAGRNNRYHHPNEETLATFTQQDLPFLNTAHYGMIEWQQHRLTRRIQLRTTLRGDERIRGQ